MQFPYPRAQVRQSSQQTRFFACHIEESYVSLAVWGVVDQRRTTVIARAHPKEWQDADTLSTAVELAAKELGDVAVGIEQMLFGVPRNWVEQDEVAGTFKELLKIVTQTVSVKPMGFVVTDEAVFQHLAKQQDAAAAMMLVEFTPAQLLVHRTQRGTSMHAEQVGRSEDVIADLTEVFARMPELPHPPQVYFYSRHLSSDKLFDEKEQFLAHDWKAEGVFAHVPQVDVLDQQIFLDAICETGGLEVVRAVGLVGDGDTVQQESSHNETPSSQVQEGVEDPEYAIDLSDEGDDDDDDASHAVRRPSFLTRLFHSVGGGDKKLPRAKLFGAVAALLIILILAAYGAVRLNTTVVATVTLEKETVFADTEITLDPKNSTDPTNNILQATVTSKTVQGTQEVSTTGTKEIGERATGTITILNKTESIKSFPAGTRLTAENKTFELNDDVSVASSSSQETANGKTLEFGAQEVEVTATQIGAEYNVPQDTEFSVANYGKDTYAGRAKSALSGGSSREIQAVAAADRQKLQQSLTQELLNQAKEALEEESAAGEYVIMTGKYRVVEQEYSATVGDEVNMVKLTMSLEVEAYVYQTKDLTPIAQAQLSSQIPQGAQLLEDTITIMSKEKPSSAGSASATIQLDAKLSAEYAAQPQVEQWTGQIAGKSLDEAKRILTDSDAIKDVSFTFSPGIAQSILRRLPGKADKISFNTVLE